MLSRERRLLKRVREFLEQSKGTVARSEEGQATQETLRCPSCGS